MESSEACVFLLFFSFVEANFQERYFVRKSQNENTKSLITDGLLICGLKCNELDYTKFRFKTADNTCEPIARPGTEDDGWTQWMSECPQPPSVDHATVEVDARLPGHHANYTCEEPHTWLGGSSSTCLPQLYWSPLGICYRYKWQNINEKVFKTDLQFGNPTDATLTIEGKSMTGERFVIQLWQNKSICHLYINCLFNYNDKVMQVEYGESINSTGEEYIVPRSHFPFRPHTLFKMDIVIERKQIKVTVDGKKLFDFRPSYTPKDTIVFSTKFLEIVKMNFTS